MSTVDRRQDTPVARGEARRPRRASRARAWDNIQDGQSRRPPDRVGMIFIVIFFGFKATNFFTAANFINIIIQMAGTTMLAYGVVFVLLLGEIDLSIAMSPASAPSWSPSSSFRAAATTQRACSRS